MIYSDTDDMRERKSRQHEEERITNRKRNCISSYEFRLHLLPLAFHVIVRDVQFIGVEFFFFILAVAGHLVVLMPLILMPLMRSLRPVLCIRL